MPNDKPTPIKLELTPELAKTLRHYGAWVMSNIVLDKSTYTLTEISRICDINPQWLRVMFKQKRVPVHKNARGHWVMNAADVRDLWNNEIAKHTRRATQSRDGKTYTYRRPTQWAYHLVVKYIDDASNGVSKTDAAIVRRVMNAAKATWADAYAVKLAKRDAAK